MGLLDEKTAIITGGGTGIGLAIARRFHQEGAHVVICGRREDKLKEAVSGIEKNRNRFSWIRADVTVEGDIERLMSFAAKQTGKIDILVNNAGIMRFGTLPESDPGMWDLTMKINVFAPWRLMVAVLPHMKKAGGGSIVNLSSIAGIKAFPGAGIYCASKAALQSISQVMAMETATEKIRVNLICPAVVEDTELAAPIFGDKVPDFYNTMRSLHPLGRNGKPADIAEAALFLASDQSDWITGIILPVDGGRHLSTNRPVVSA
jgi:NAD(P)-dependent dehydrogenase (short-subunit alcohol dehydrogenase family)